MLGIDVEGGRVRGVRTTRGDFEAELVVICCGVWSPRIARMAGASIPLTPMVHQMIDIGPVPRFATASASSTRSCATWTPTCTSARRAASLEIGSYAHRPILHDPDEIPSIEESALSPTELPFTQADFEPQLEQALELMPEIVGDESVGIKYAINGLLSVTADGLPLLGETPEVRGLWCAAAVWIKEGPGVGKTVAELILARRLRDRRPRVEHRARLPDQQTRRHVQARASEGFNKMYGIVHPAEQWESDRARPPLARSTSASARSAPSSSRPPAGSAPTGTSRTRRCSRSTAIASRAARPSGSRAGGRRSSTPSTSRCATARR